MNSKINCLAAKYACMASQLDSRYKPIWIRKGFANDTGVAQTRIENIFLGYCLIQTVSTGLAGVEIGRQSGDVGKPITINTNDLEVQIIKATVKADWYREQVIYYAIQEKFIPVSSQFFLDQFGDIDAKRYKVLELIDRSSQFYKLIFRELETRRLRTNEHISH